VHGAGLRHIKADRRVNEWRAPGRRTIMKAATNERQVLASNRCTAADDDHCSFSDFAHRQLLQKTTPVWEGGRGLASRAPSPFVTRLAAADRGRLLGMQPLAMAAGNSEFSPWPRHIPCKA